MNEKYTTECYNANILFIGDESATFIEISQVVGLDNIQISTPTQALQLITQAAKSHYHIQLIFVQDDVLSLDLLNILKTVRANPTLRIPVVTLFNTEKTQQILANIDGLSWYELVDEPTNQEQLEHVIEHAFQKHQAQKHDLIDRLNNFNPNILVVEDDNVNQQILKLMLDNFSCQYDLVGSGQDALTKAGQNNYDVMLLDIGLPDINGFEVTKQLREQGVDSDRLPVIALTAFIPHKAVSQCEEAGMNDVITKPVMLPGLQYAIACNLISKI